MTDGAALTVMLSDFVAATLLLSVTLTVKVWLVAEPPTVPEMTPPLLRLRPLGSDPLEMLQVNGLVPPDSARVCE